MQDQVQEHVSCLQSLCWICKTKSARLDLSKWWNGALGPKFRDLKKQLLRVKNSKQLTHKGLTDSCKDGFTPQESPKMRDRNAMEGSTDLALVRSALSQGSAQMTLSQEGFAQERLRSYWRFIWRYHHVWIC